MEIKDYFLKQLFYTAFRFPRREPYDSYDFDKEFVLNKLSTVNIFVGANNSGKSRLLRELFRMSDFEYKTNFFQSDEFRKYLLKLRSTYKDRDPSSILDQCKQFEFDPTLVSHPNKSSVEYFKSNAVFIDQLRTLIETTEHFTRNHVGSIGADFSTKNWLETVLNQYFNEWMDIFRKRPESLETFKKIIGNENRLYIPILRGMRSFADTEKNEYAERTADDYFSGNKNWKNGGYTLRVFTGLELYADLKRKLLGEPDERALIRGFEDFLGSQFFDGKSITLIPREGKDARRLGSLHR